MFVLRNRSGRYVQAEDFTTGYFRGYTFGFTLSEAELDAAIAAGGRIFRFWLPFQYANGAYGPMTSGNADIARNLIAWAEKKGVFVVPTTNPPPYVGNDGGLLRWNSSAWMDSFAATWASFAKDFASSRAIAAWDVTNEPDPYGGSGGPLGSDEQAVDLLMRKCIAAIRAVDPNHVICASTSGANLTYGFGRNITAGYLRSGAPNLVYSLHAYRPHDITHRGVTYPGSTYPTGTLHPSWLRADYAQVEQWQRATGIPIFVGEWSVSRFDPASNTPRLTFIDDMLNHVLERNRWAWCWHTWNDGMVVGNAWGPWQAGTDGYTSGQAGTLANNAAALNKLRNRMGKPSVP